MQTVSAEDGRTLCTAEWGDPAGAPVFSLHGTPGCRLFGRRAIELGLDEVVAAVGVRLLTYDRPGYGLSDRQSGRRVVDTAGDVASIAAAFGIERFAVQGGSSGSAHALAVAALLHSQVRRVALVAPMAPYDRLGSEEWSRGQPAEVREYVAACLEGGERLNDVVAGEDAESRAGASRDDPRDAEVFEQTRNGLDGWIDDELAVFRPWGFEPASVVAPLQVWFDPDDPVLPPQHAEWMAATITGASLIQTRALGHGSKADPREDWHRLYDWLRGA